MIRARLPRVGSAGGAPRVSGDDPLDIIEDYLMTACSPRERG